MPILHAQDLSSDAYWSLLELATDGIWWWNVAEDEVRWSPSLARSFGYEEHDRALADIMELTHPADRERHRRALEEHLRCGGAYDATFRFRRADGAYRWVRSRGATRADEEGRPLMVFGYVTDITEQREGVEALRISEARFRAFMDHCPAAAFLKDPAGRHLCVNPAAAELAGTTQEAMLGRRISEVIPAESSLELEAIDREVLATGEVRRWTGPIVRPDGSRRWILDVKFPVELDDGEVAVGGFGVDLTELRQAQEAAESMERLESLGRLAGGIAHDFNNMLTVILGNARMAAKHLDDPRLVRQGIAEVIDAGERSAGMTSQLLAFARRRGAGMEVVDLRQRITGTAGLLRRLIGEDITLELQLAPDVSPVRMDASAVDQILMNLCVNARDAQPDGGRIVIRAEDVAAPSGEGREGRVLVSVRDEGTGMDAETRERVFEPFFTTKPSGEGTGLGLATVYGIVTQSGGEIEALSEPGEGTEIRIPLPRAHTAVVDGTDPSGSPAPRARQGTVLLVEDAQALLRLTRRMLEELGYRVLSTDSPEEALRLAEAEVEAIDVLLTDVVMPGMSGPELSERLHRIDPGVRTVYTSGYADEVLAERGLSASEVIFLQKPFTLDELDATMRRVLSPVA
jgi:PAS domain S-box-containing protein